MKKFIVLAIILIMATAAYATDWSNPAPQAGGDKAGPLLLKHEANMVSIFAACNASTPIGFLNCLKGNFSGAAAPTGASTGQAWHDSANNMMKWYNGTWGGAGLYSTVTSSLATVQTTTLTATSATIGTATTTTLAATSATLASAVITTVTGTTNFSGPATFSTYSTSFSGATGTAPFSVTSTTKVDNLNADLLDNMTTASANTGTTVVNRDASGNFAAGTITATLSGTATNATNATGTGTALYSDVNGFKIVSGTIQSDGTCITGVTGIVCPVTHGGTGSYTIAFAITFSSAPSCAVSPYSSMAMIGTTSTGTTGFSVGPQNVAGTPIDNAFTFVCVGPK